MYKEDDRIYAIVICRIIIIHKKAQAELSLE